jgi:hypothetical protein
MTCRRLLLVALALAALLSTVESGSAAARARRPRLAVPLPKPGHVTVAAFDVRASSAGLARRVRIGAPGAHGLPPSVKVLWATRSIATKGGRRYAGLVFVVRRAEASASARAAGDAPDEPNIVDLIFRAAPGGCVDCRMTETVTLRDVDLFMPRQVKPLDNLFRRDWEPVFGAGGHEPDPTLDTGHYDDGHSFGWGAPKRPSLPPRDVERVEIDLVQDLLDAQPGRLVPDLELATKVDLSGDGKVGTSSGQRIDTRVGQPVVT